MIKRKTLIVLVVFVAVIVAATAFLVLYRSSLNSPSKGQNSAGVTLYGQNCEGCHGPLATSARRGRTAEQIQNAINTVPAMNARLRNLTTSEIQQIAEALR